MVSNPEHVKQVFTGDPSTFHAGEGNRILLPVLGENSLLLLDERPHMHQRKLLLPPFHGARMQGYTELMTEVARGGDRAVADAAWPTACARGCRRSRSRSSCGRCSECSEPERLGRPARRLRRLLDVLTSPLMLGVLGAGTRAPGSRSDRSRGCSSASIGCMLDEIAERRQAPDLAERADILSLLLQARDEDGGADERPRAARRADDAAGRRPRDDGDRTGLGGRAPDPPSRGARAADRGGARRARRLPRRGRHRDAASATGDLARGPAPDEPIEIGGLELPAGVTVTPSIYLLHRRPDVYPEPERFRPERFLDSRPAPTRGSRSAAACAAASAPPSPGSRCAWCSPSSSAGASLRPARPEHEPKLRRAITETPRYDAEVVLELADGASATALSSGSGVPRRGGAGRRRGSAPRGRRRRRTPASRATPDRDRTQPCGRHLRRAVGPAAEQVGPGPAAEALLEAPVGMAPGA